MNMFIEFLQWPEFKIVFPLVKIERDRDQIISLAIFHLMTAEDYTIGSRDVSMHSIYLGSWQCWSTRYWIHGHRDRIGSHDKIWSHQDLWSTLSLYDQTDHTIWSSSTHSFTASASILPSPNTTIHFPH